MIGFFQEAAALLLGVLLPRVFPILQLFFVKQEPSNIPKLVLDILGKLSIMLVSGDLHTKLRNIAVSFISTSRSRLDFLCYVQKLSILVMESWREHLEVAVYEKAKKFTLYVMLKYVLDIEPEDSIPLVGVLLDILDILGKLSIMLVSGDLHTKLRNIAVSFISTSRSRPDFLCYVQKLSILVMESWREHQEVAFYEEAKNFTLYVMLKYVFDIELEDSIPLVGVLLDILDILGKLSIILVSGDLHTKLRNIAVSFISTSRSRPDFLCYVQKLSILVMESWREHLEVDVYEEAKKFTLYVMLKYVLDIEPEDSIPLVGVLLDILDIFGKLSIMLVSGDLHTKLRNIAVSFISPSRSRPDFLCYVEKLSILVMESWREHQEVAFYDEAKKFTFYVMLKYVLDIEPEDSLAPRILEDFLTFINGFVSIPLYVPGTPYAKAVKARGRLSSTLKEIIKERENRDVGHVGKGDFLDKILQKGDLSDEKKVFIFVVPLSVNHVLLWCPFVWRVWANIFLWWGSQWVMPTTVDGVLQFWAGFSGNSFERKVWNVLPIASLWSIWKHRNEVLFSDLQPELYGLCDLIKTRTAMWVRAADAKLPFSVNDFLFNLQQIKFCRRGIG
ncbi:Cytochrome P450 724B1 [Camellia lanceoleosa]|uniref:Cytochrome P450 724B1 n=1 Tax=Camellia lanceoleosa TaxID=1840588 RepID=A0ACC0IWN3_9ERIC|nr:Cytochrome P450 724B1 [Camellia lanceoleosa]